MFGLGVDGEATMRGQQIGDDEAGLDLDLLVGPKLEVVVTGLDRGLADERNLRQEPRRRDPLPRAHLDRDPAPVREFHGEVRRVLRQRLPSVQRNGSGFSQYGDDVRSFSIRTTRLRDSMPSHRTMRKFIAAFDDGNSPETQSTARFVILRLCMGLPTNVGRPRYS